MALPIGDKVSYFISGHGVARSDAWVIGVPTFSDGDHVTLATEAAHGIPLNVCWCNRIDGADPQSAMRWRERYLSMYPGALKPTPPGARPTGEER
jgi:hypothetical protein